MSAYYEVRGGEMPAFGVALDVVLAAAVAALDQGAGWVEFLPVSASHPLAVPVGGQVSEALVRAVAAGEVLWPSGGGAPVPFERVRTVELTNDAGQLLGLSSVPGGMNGRRFPAPVAHFSYARFGADGVAPQELGEAVELGEGVFAVEVGGGGVGGVWLELVDGSVVPVDWGQAARFLKTRLPLEMLRGREVPLSVVVVAGEVAAPQAGDLLEVVRPGQEMATAWGLRAGGFSGPTALRGASGGLPPRVLWGLAEPGAEAKTFWSWFRPEPSVAELKDLGRELGWRGQAAFVLRWVRGARLLVGSEGEGGWSWTLGAMSSEYVRVLRALAAVDELRLAGGETAPLTWGRLGELVDEYYGDHPAIERPDMPG
ncbi:hypothetical protein, partial [Streptomyces sp. NPDC048527]|uniref:hypothetical protein n=1 Tax=Streptomyces sp. NPDC048527 TaxID=3365568 RepID=UPI003713FCD4